MSFPSFQSIIALRASLYRLWIFASTWGCWTQKFSSITYFFRVYSSHDDDDDDFFIQCESELNIYELEIIGSFVNNSCRKKNLFEWKVVLKCTKVYESINSTSSLIFIYDVMYHKHSL